jgi:EAL domain-containing protein (putative c-di-GMP-specific phosphodiesterase class I)
VLLSYTAQDLIGIMTEAGADPTSMIVEVTESVAMSEVGQIEALLADLNTHGVTLAIDDFGTGYSSLSRLIDLPVTMLKVDRSLVGSINRAQSAAIVTGTIIQLTRNLGMQTVAEGVETREQLEFLREHDCLLGQGYLFSRPVTAKEFTTNGCPTA